MSFPDVRRVTTAVATMDEAIGKAGEVPAFAAEDWAELSGEPLPRPRTVDELRAAPRFAAP